MIKRLCTLAALLVLAACGGHGGGSSTATATNGSNGTATGTPPPPALTNFATVTVDAGPPALSTGPNGYSDANLAFVSVTICAPGTSTCQTIDHVEVDTGSVGLRLLQSAVSPTVRAALPNQSDAQSNPVGECYQFVSGYAFGSVRQADVTIGGEAVANMPLQVTGDTGAFANTPSSCSSSGGIAFDTVYNVGANGILGIGVTTTDCGAYCTTANGSGAATYYDCPSSGCGAVITRAAATTAPFQQLPNPVAAMSVDNNGTILSLPPVATGGQPTLTGTLYFGIGTQTNNGLGSAKVLEATTSDSLTGPGLLTAVYNGKSLPDSFIDSGTNIYLFEDDTIPACTDPNLKGYYCPPSPLALTPTLQGTNGASASAAFTLTSAQILLTTTYSAIPGIGASPRLLDITDPYPSSFDFGLPFFFGRNVYTALEGRTAGSAVGPYFAY